MSDLFTELTQEKMDEAISTLLLPKIGETLQNRGPGHCIRVSDIDDNVMNTVCLQLRENFKNHNVFILGNHEQANDTHIITSTKLVELRNPLEDGTLRQPLLVFIPTSLKTSAEDSFSIATFEELTFSEIYKELIEKSLERIPTNLINSVKEIFTILDEERWEYASELSKTRYLLTALNNGVDGEILGASIYELGLTPDFKLFEDISLINGKIRRNLEAVRELVFSHKSTRKRILDLGLNNKVLVDKLNSFFSTYDIYEPNIWTQQIALNKNWWPISFDKWTFEEELILDKISVNVLETDLPCVQDSEDGQLSELVGQQVLVPKERRKLNVVFEVNPHPKKVNGLDHFTLQIISQAGGPVGNSKKVKAWSSKKVQSTVSISKLDKYDFEEGWHYIRVSPWTSDGDPIPLLTISDDSKRPNESEPFYVLPDGTIEDAPPQRAIPHERSLEHAKFRLKLTAINEGGSPEDISVTDISWADKGKTRKSVRQETIIVKFGREGAIQIPISKTLKQIENRILASPFHPSGWRMQINLDTPEPISQISLELPNSAAMHSFLAARKDLFEEIYTEDSEMIMQGFDFKLHKNKCINYVESYINIINTLNRKTEQSTGADKQNYLKELKNLLMVDSVHVILTDFRGRHREASLISPTHPLKIIWFLAWHTLGEKWLCELKSTNKDYLSIVRHALLEGMSSSNFPIGVPVEDGRIFTSVENVNPFWGFYSPTTEDNTRGLMAEICTALGLSEPSTAGADISGSTLADKIDRYLSQHPYTKELSINIFNPGSGAIVADALICLQQRKEYSSLRYDIRLFTSDPESPSLGEVLESMLKIGNSQKHEAVDAFSTSTGNHLFSKMSVAKHTIEDFHSEPDQYSAHISILMDVFPAEELSVREKVLGIAPLHGLIQGYHNEFIDDDRGTFWNKSPIIGLLTNEQDVSGCYHLLTSLSEEITIATSSVATNGANCSSTPMVTLCLTVQERELIYQVHQVSDWVFTIDRYMGIEFFDHGGRKNRPDYLIDYVPGTSAHKTHNLIISSRSNEELEAMLKPVLKEHGLKADRKQSLAVLSHLRSLSGQLALKLISAPTQQSEALGLALARLYLEYQGALSNQIILPLDAHIELYSGLNTTDISESSVSLQRTDLALFDLDLNKRSITCNLVEVKCYKNVGDFSAFNQLKERISQQINQSERVLQRHYDPRMKSPDRPDRLLKNRELSLLLQFYLERSIRYGIFDSDAAFEARQLLASIDKGYSLQFRRSAIIFDFEKNGTDLPDNEVGIEYHRIGKDLILDLLDNCGASHSESEDSHVATSLSEQSIPSIPKLKTAAFIVSQRDRKSNTELFETSIINQSNQDIEDIVLTSEKGSSIAKSVDGEDKVSHEAADMLNTSISTDPIAEESYDCSNIHEPSIRSDAEDNADCIVNYDVMLGVNSASPQYGLLGETSGRKVALDLNHTHTISLFGVQGGGKSYTLGTVIEMASMKLKNINVLPSPLATVIFHYSPTQDYSPEFTSMINPNTIEEELKILNERYSARPEALNDILVLTPRDKVDARRTEFQNLSIQPIAFSASELKASHWKFLMGAIGSQSLYMRQINHIMRRMRGNLTIDSLEYEINNSNLSDHLKELALTRLQFAREYIDDNQKLQDMIRPGRLIIVDLRDEYIEKDEALGLFVVMLQILSEATFNGINFNKLVVFDEAHKYIESDDLVSGLVEVVREMRHKGTSIMVASQDPPSVPVSLIELSTQIIMHKFNSPAWLKHIQKANAALGELTSSKMSHLGTGEAYIWSSKASDESFTKGAIKIKCRPRVTQHGGNTKTAL